VVPPPPINHLVTVLRDHRLLCGRIATEASVAAVGRIEQTIDEVNAIAGSIAAAIEQQAAATEEIARNVTQTSAAANEMTSRVAAVSTEAEQTGRHAVEVHDDTARLRDAVEHLKQGPSRRPHLDG
jgi:methyl-accepting chemotaxis protein